MWRTITCPRTGQPVAACPICHKAPDCTGHILGGCTHPTIQAMKTARHNKACVLVAETIAKGEEGDGFMVLGAVASNCLPDYAHGTRLPKWLLPALDDDTRVKLRPDILYIPSIKPHLRDARTFDEVLMQLTPTQRAQHPVILLEVGYCSDFAHDEKITQKAAQHAELAQLLTAEGWPVTYGTADAITLGVCGTIPAPLIARLTELGAFHAQAKRCVQALHSHAIYWMDRLISKRRWLQRCPKDANGLPIDTDDPP